MGTGGRPGKFPAKVTAVKGNKVTFEADAKDIEYLKSQLGEIGILEWTPNSYSPDAGDKAASAG